MESAVKESAIRFQAQVFKVQSLIDGGLRLTLDLGNVAPEIIVALFDARLPGVILEVAAVAIKPSSDYLETDNLELKYNAETT